MATKGYYCTLCKEHAGDDISAEHHIKTENHYLKYQDYLKENPFYEQRFNLDKAAGMSLMKEEEKKMQKNLPKKEEVKKQDVPKKVEEPKEKDPAAEARKVEQKKKMQAIWDKHINSKQQEKTTQNEKGNNEEEKEKEKGKIQINILNKTGFKPKQATPPPKKNPVLPPWNPVSKEQKKQAAKVEPVRKASVEIIDEPPSLDDFITVGENQKIPVVSEKRKMILAQSLIDKVQAKKQETLDQVEKEAVEKIENEAEENKIVEIDEKKEIEKKENKNIISEEKKDLDMLAITSDDSAPIEEIKPPPPPSQNLSLPTEKNEKMATITSEEMCTLFFSDDKQIIVATDEKQIVKTKADDLVEIDAQANVTYMSDEEDSNNKSIIKIEEKQPVPLELAKDSDVVVISIDSQSDESCDEDTTKTSETIESKTDENTEMSETKVEKVTGEGADEETEIKTDPIALKENDESAEIQHLSVVIDGKSTNDKLDSTGVDAVQASKIEVLSVSQNVSNKGRRRPQKADAKNMTEVTIIDENEGNTIEVVLGAKDTTEKKPENVIEVVQTHRTSQIPAPKAAPRTRELSNLHDVNPEQIEEIKDTSKIETKSIKKKVKPEKRTLKKTRSVRKKSMDKKKAERTKYVPKRHLQVDIVSISDDEERNAKYENVDSASDFSDPELENISSSSEKFVSDINEHLENVSSDSEIDNNDDDLENISSDEMESNLMMVDEVGEVDDFADFDFNDDANVVDQVGDSDEEMEVKVNHGNSTMQKMELEIISDTEDGDFNKDDDDKKDEQDITEKTKEWEKSIDIPKEDQVDLKPSSENVENVPTDSKLTGEEEQSKEIEIEAKIHETGNETKSTVEATKAGDNLSDKNDEVVEEIQKDSETQLKENKDTTSQHEILSESENITIDTSQKVEIDDTSEEISKTDISSLDDSLQEEDIPAKTTRGRKRGRGRGRGGSRRGARRGRSGAKKQNEVEENINTEQIEPEESQEAMDVSSNIQNMEELIDNKDQNETDEKTDETDPDTSKRTPRRGRSAAKTHTESKEDEKKTELSIPTNAPEIMIDNTVISQTENQEKHLEVMIDLSEESGPEKQADNIEEEEVSKVEEVLNVEQIREETTTSTILTENDTKSPNMDKSSVTLQTETLASEKVNVKTMETEMNLSAENTSGIESAQKEIDMCDKKTIEPEIIDLDSDNETENENNILVDSLHTDEIDSISGTTGKAQGIETPEQENKPELLLLENQKTSEIVDTVHVANAKKDQLISGFEVLQEDENDQNTIIVSANEEQTSSEIAMETSTESNIDDSDIISLEMEELVPLESLSESIEESSNEVDNSKSLDLDNEEVQENVNIQLEVKKIEIEKTSDINQPDKNIADGQMVLLSDNSDVTSENNQSKTPVCLELNIDNLETFNLNKKSDLSVSIDSFESNKNSSVSDLVHLELGNIDHLPILQEDHTRDSDNGSSTSEIKIDVVLEAIDSLCRFESPEKTVDSMPKKCDETKTKQDDTEIITEEKEVKDDIGSSSHVNVERDDQSNSQEIVEKGDIGKEVEKDDLGKDVDMKDSSESIEISLTVHTSESSLNQDLAAMSTLDGNETDNEEIHDLEHEDAASVGSGISMDMGSDFEVLDECESD